MTNKIYTKEECDVFNNQSNIKLLMEVSSEIKELHKCIENLEANYIPWTRFIWIFGGTMGFIFICGGALFAQLSETKAELGVYKGEMAKEISDIKQATTKTATDVSWIVNKLTGADIE